MPNPHLHEICRYLDEELRNKAYRDSSLNGLQLESSASLIQKIGFSVDAGLSVAEKAVAEGCQLLVVHHGILWGTCERLVGPYGKKVSYMMRNGLSLYANHLPLDGHPVLGNAAQMASLLKLQNIEPCFDFGGASIGVKGVLPTPRTIEDLATELSALEGALQPPLALPFGKTVVSSIGIATGAGTSVIPDCEDLGIELLITGEPKQSAFHAAKEHFMSVLCIGHYASETFGVRALERVLKERFRVETTWISEPTGI